MSDELKRLRAQGASIAVLSSVLHLAGWELRDIDLDLISGRARVELHRYDGRRVLLSTDAIGRTSLERSHRTIALGRHSSTRGRIPLSPQIEDEFLGRQRCEGPRSGLRALCSYVATNPAPGRQELPPSAVRAAFAPLMGAPARAALREEAPDARD